MRVCLNDLTAEFPLHERPFATADQLSCRHARGRQYRRGPSDSKREIVIIDGYVDMGTLNTLPIKKDGIVATVWTRPNIMPVSLTSSTVLSRFGTRFVPNRGGSNTGASCV